MRKFASVVALAAASPAPAQAATSIILNPGGNAAFLIDSIAVAAPEPATWLMMILGFGLVGSQLRRRKPGLALATA